MTVVRLWHYLPIVVSIFIASCVDPGTSVPPPLNSDSQKKSVVRITRMPVSSSALVAVGYDAERQIFEVEFHNDDVYQYFDVPKYEYVGLMNAKSHGRYFYRHIRSAGYQYERITR